MSYMFVDSFRAGAYISARKLSTNLCDVYHFECTVDKLLMMNRRTVRNM